MYLCPAGVGAKGFVVPTPHLPGADIFVPWSFEKDLAMCERGLFEL